MEMSSNCLNGPNKVDNNKITINVEAVVKQKSLSNRDELKTQIIHFIKSQKLINIESLIDGSKLPDSFRSQVEHIRICETIPISERKCFDSENVELLCHLHTLDEEGPCLEEMGSGNEEGSSPAATQWILPSKEFANLWETLIYDTNIKEQLLNFANTTLLFSDKAINNEIISWNKVVLLHGPPGTGKTSLCKALAHKLSIRLGHRYQLGILVEINSHSLFSKWFSESGKLVQSLFNRIIELLENPDALVFVLIDEVESLTRSRSATSCEPSDALRVVNALLTQIDFIRRYPNVMILTTSNITGQIDVAFVDRADIKHYIGLPSASAIYQIYYSCLCELMDKGIIAPEEHLLTVRQLDITNRTACEVTKCSISLWHLSEESIGLSGRTLRKLPFLAHALFLQSPSTSLPDFLQAMRLALIEQKRDNESISSSRK